MILNRELIISYFSQLTYPDHKGLMDLSLKTEREGRRIDNILDLKITNIFTMQDVYNGKIYEIFKGRSDFNLHTNGKITVHQLFDVFREAHNIFVNALNQLEKQIDMQPTTNLHFPPLSYHLEDLTDLVKRFEQG